MKIGIFTDSNLNIINGVSVSTKSLQKGLEMLGHKVYIITTNEPISKDKKKIIVILLK
ncbi:MAG: hypothetical protein Q8779_02080 [Candidatus Phytoplasma stylosanthis]|uniref:hypothetical protein n=1 Tax=Candidatus Phytoplasma stylosanthis TaxID=2798314 RepID=UPI002939BFCB|nr:hypothetical protein [Candidatus Phytoplasma stylosanthis]MDV3174340.1 hypothetical protein [Candidatus Phytoplasma stylosanthis]